MTTLSWVVERFGWRCHAYCLMDNHFHLLIETPDPNLSRGMRQLNGVYTQGFNRRHRQVGHLFQGRFKAIIVEKDSYVLELARYIVLNPVRAKVVTSPDKYWWSSYRPTLGLSAPPPALETDWLFDQFAKTKSAARKRYAEFVLSGIGNASPWKDLKAQVVLGGEDFVEKLAARLKDQSAMAEVPKRQRLLHRPTLSNLLGKVNSKAARNHALARACLEHDYTLAEIGVATGLHYATISRIVKALEKMS